jgi:hypothetical protein
MKGYLADGTPIRADRSPRGSGSCRWSARSTRRRRWCRARAATSARRSPAELDGLRKMMGDQNSEYWKGPKAEANQKRYRELIDADQKMKAKAA